MLRKVKDLTKFTITAMDGEIGHVAEFYFDDKTWTIRYLVANTGNWLADQLVLLAPGSLKQPNWEEGLFPVTLTKEQVENSPLIQADQPVSRHRETELLNHYEWPIYWGHAGAFPIRPLRMQAEAATLAAEKDSDTEADNTEADNQEHDNHLRSTQAVTGYTIQATDGNVGYVSDFIIDDENWIIRYLVVDTGHFLPGRKVLISPDWVLNVSWYNQQIEINISQETLKNSPTFDPSLPITRVYEEQLYNYYGWLKYWYGDSPQNGVTMFTKNIMGNPIYDIHTGQQLGHVEDILIDPEASLVAAIITNKTGLIHHTQYAMLTTGIKVWGPDALLAEGAGTIIEANSLERYNDWLSISKDMTALNVLNQDSTTIGQLKDIVFDTNKRIVAYELDYSDKKNALAGQHLLMANTTRALGKNALVVDLRVEA